MLRSTQVSAVTDHAAAITIADARFPQKVYGGRIVAKNVRNVAIPIAPRRMACGRGNTSWSIG